MSCQLTQNIPIDTCKTNIGGIKQVLVMPFQNISGSITVVSGSVTNIPIGPSGSGYQYYTYSFRKETGTAKADTKISDENASVYSEQQVDIEFTRMEIVKRNEFALLAQNDLSMIVYDNLGQYWLYGASNGMVPKAFNGESGKKYGDGSKYKLSFSGVEPFDVYQVSGGLIPLLTVPH